MIKKYIRVIAIFNEDGSLIPTTILWEDDRKFSIDKILEIRREASVKYGAIGTKYICKVHGKQVNLFNEDNSKWFIEQR